MTDALEFRHLKYLVAIAETSNFTRAAQRLFLAQPSLSRQIRDLEEALGFAIFVRHKDGVRVTPAGQVIIDYAEEMLSGRAEILKIAREINAGRVPLLRIGFSSFVNARHLQHFRSIYTAIFRGCTIQPSSGDTVPILKKLQRHELDCALLPLPVRGPEWNVVQFARTPLVACMRADDPLANQMQIDIPTLAEHLTISRDPEGHPSAHSRLLEMFSEAGCVVHISSCAATPHDIQTLVKEGYGMALIAEDALLDSTLTSRSLSGVEWTSDIALVYPVTSEHVALPFVAKALLKPARKKVQKPAETLPLRFDETA